MTWIQTYSGQAVDLIEPDPATINILDIAHALSRICRFTGHTEKHYSVAQHSVLVSRELPTGLALAGLLHDAAEAYVQDVSAPMRAAMRHEDRNVSGGVTAYAVIERRMQRAVYERFGLTLAETEDRIKIADLRVFAAEAEDLGFLSVAPRLWDLPYTRQQTPIYPWDGDTAKAMFLATAANLGVLS